MISYKYNIYHSKKTKYLDKMLRECCFVWNHALALQRRYHKLFGKYISIGKMKKHFTKRIKKNLLHSQTTQEILERLDESYNRFFKKLAKRPPKFKRADCFNSFVFKQGGFTLNGNFLTINKGKKRFRFSYSRPYEGNVKQIRIVRETCSRFSLIIVTDHNPSNSYRKTHDGASIGLDFGLKTYLTKSDGSKIDSPLFFKRYQNKIRKLNKRFSNAKKGSNNRRRRLRAFPNWRVWVIPAIEIPGFHTFVSKNPICFSYGSMSRWQDYFRRKPNQSQERNMFLVSFTV